MNETVSLVGRTNVGKSSLFNKLAKSKSALVSEQEGLTRDIKSASVKMEGKSVNFNRSLFSKKNIKIKLNIKNEILK